MCFCTDLDYAFDGLTNMSTSISYTDGCHCVLNGMRGIAVNFCAEQITPWDEGISGVLKNGCLFCGQFMATAQIIGKSCSFGDLSYSFDGYSRGSMISELGKYC